MATGKLILNDKEVPMKPGTVVALTFQVNDVGSVENRQSNFSNTFNVEKSNDVLINLEHADKVTSKTTLPYQKIPARYIQDGIQIIKNGFAILTSASDIFEVTLFDGNLSFFDLIDGKRLKEIDSLEDFMWDYDTAFASRGNTSNEIWAIIDWFVSLSITDRVFDITKAHPSFFLKDIIAQIFAPTGYTLKGDFLSSSLYENLILPLITDKQDQRYLEGKAQLNTVTHDGPLGSYIFWDEIISDPLRDFTSGAQNLFFQVDVSLWEYYAAYGNGKYSFRFHINYTTGVDGGYVEIQATSDVMVLKHIDLLPSTTGTLDFEIRDVELNGIAGVFLFFTSGATSMTINAGTTIECFGADVVTEPGNIFPVAVNLPDLGQKDLLKAIMQMYCIIPITNTFKKEVHFIQFKEIVKNKALAKDWTTKINMDRAAKISYRYGDYAQTNHLTYLQDDTVIEEFGDGTFSIADSSLVLDRTLITLPFAASQMVPRMSGLSVPEIQQDAKPRILILDKQLISKPHLEWTDGTSTSFPTDAEPMCYFALDGKSDNLKFSDNLLSEQYADFILMLNNFKKIVVAANLTASDIEQLDFSIPIYLKQFGAYFYLNAVNQWIDESTPCEIELVRLP